MTNDYNDLIKAVLRLDFHFRNFLSMRGALGSRLNPMQKIAYLNDYMESDEIKQYNPTGESVTLVGKRGLKAPFSDTVKSGSPILMYYTSKGTDMYLVLGVDILKRTVEGSLIQNDRLSKGTLITMTQTEVQCLLETYPELFGIGDAEDRTLQYMMQTGQINDRVVNKVTLGELLLYTTEGWDMTKVSPDLYLAYLRVAKSCFTYTFEDKTICYLPIDVCVMWTERLRTAAGTTEYKSRYSFYDYYNFKIKLSSPYHRKFPDEVMPTLLHEMVHIFLPAEGHSKIFTREIERLSKETGYNVTRYSREVSVANWYLYCPYCGKIYKRANKPRGRYSCGECDTELDIYSVDDFAELVEMGLIATNETVTR